ncbi:thiolase C-terminal domain-containing protein [Microbacterium sp. CPCC 204701]|uniref:thiolase C-terminal domain-containing protein n=1 Tax=Microbacterium sp. CPCC 204701 TaxID=2493084 RepID=UPI000FDBDDC5|nr:thiolase [Microbacterium sp. CPCC 204701]
MRPGDIVIVGAAETEELGVIPDMSELDLRAAAAHAALADAGLSMADVDGITCAAESPIEMAHYLGLTPTWYDGTSVGGCSFLIHVRHAAAAISAGLCETVLVLHGESGRSKVGKGGGFMAKSPSSMQAQFQNLYGLAGPPNMFTLPVKRFLEKSGNTEEQMAAVVAAQSAWSADNPRAFRKGEVSVQDVLDSPIIAYPFHKLECCVVTDGGGALVVTSRRLAESRGVVKPPVYVLGTGEAADAPLVHDLEDATSSKAFRISSELAFREAGLRPSDIDHLMVYDAFAHLPLYALEDLGFVGRGESGAFIAEGRTRPGGELPLNTNGGGLRYTHTGMYGMFAMQEAVRQLRGEAFSQVEGITTSLVQGVGGMFTAAATLIFSNEAP